MLRTLRRHFMLAAVGGSEQVVTGNRRPLGYQQLTLDASTAQGLSLTTPQVVATATALSCSFLFADNQSTTIAIRWRDDGTDPTTTTGNRIVAGAVFQYCGDLNKIKFIGESGTPILNCSVYG